jgi:hypothetical protein
MRTTFTKFILSFLCISAMHIALAQPSWQWAKGAGQGGSESTSGVTVDASGNVYAIGWYTSPGLTFGAYSILNAGTSDVFLVKYDAAGNALWAKTYGGADGEIGNAITADGSGNVYITGLFTSTTMVMGTFTLINTAPSSNDIFIAKIGPTGNVIWAKSAGGASNDKGNGIAVDASGNVYTTGSFSGPGINFGTGTISNAGNLDIFIVKHDMNGNAVWAYGIGGSSADVGNAIAVDASGNIYMTGMFMSAAVNFGTGILTNSASGTQDLFIAKYTSAGTATWSSRSGGSMDDYGTGIAVGKTNLYVTGAFNSTSVSFGTTTLTNASAGSTDILLAKYDLTGNAGWAKRAGGSDFDSGSGLSCDSLGNVFMSGSFNSSSLTFGTITVNNTSANNSDLFITAYDGNGAALWAIEEGDTYGEFGNSIAVSGSGTDVIIGGSYNSAAVAFGPFVVTKGCGDDVLVAKLNAPAVGINEKSLANSLTVYPNPTNGKFKIEAEGQVTFYNILGEAILIEKLTGKNEFDFSSLPTGVYLYKILNGNKAMTGRVVVE